MSPVLSKAFDGWRWTLSPEPPPLWLPLIDQLGGGFFHSGLGLLAGAPAGESMFLTLWDRTLPVAAAAGVRYSCRVSRTPRHMYFPTLPALADRATRGAALALLRSTLHEHGAADVVLDCFDASWTPETMFVHEAGDDRIEFVVPLDNGADAEHMRYSRCDEHHRRTIRRGEREGWVLRVLSPEEALPLLQSVVDSALRRSLVLNRRFSSVIPLVASAVGHDTVTDSGVAVLGAWHRDAALGAALVGWAGHRVFYISGGSTTAGYRNSSAVWLHWKAMSLFAASGRTAYNFGGVPAAAAADGHPLHGLFRFKRAFGADQMQCTGVRWSLSQVHARAHAGARMLRSLASAP